MKKIKSGRHWIFSRYVEDEEKIQNVIHRHVLVFKLSILKIGFFGILLPILLYLLLPKAIFFAAIWFTIGFFAILYKFIDWYFDVWLLTNLGVVDLERNGLFDLTSTRIEYHMMEGLSYQIKGVLRTLFNFGDITIDKLGAQTSVILRDSISPKKVERLVLKYQEMFVSEKSVRDHHALKDMLADMIACHIQKTGGSK